MVLEYDKKQTDETNTEGTKDNIDVATDEGNLSEYDKALALVKRREEATKAEKELLEEKKKYDSNAMLAGTAGGHIDSKPKEESDHDYRVRVAKEMAEGKTDFW